MEPFINKQTNKHIHTSNIGQIIVRYIYIYIYCVYIYIYIYINYIKFYIDYRGAYVIGTSHEEKSVKDHKSNCFKMNEFIYNYEICHISTLR